MNTTWGPLFPGDSVSPRGSEGEDEAQTVRVESMRDWKMELVDDRVRDATSAWGVVITSMVETSWPLSSGTLTSRCVLAQWKPGAAQGLTPWRVTCSLTAAVWIYVPGCPCQRGSGHQRCSAGE